MLTACASPLTSERLVPAVPHESQYPVHAPCAPIAVCPVIRHPTDLSQRSFTASGFDDVKVLNDASSKGLLSLVSQTRTCLGTCPKLLLQCSRPRLLTAAAWSGLGPAPESRSRGARPHLSRSCTTLLQSMLPPFYVSLQHTASRPVELHHQPLSELSVTLSRHSAPIRQTYRSCQVANARRDPRSAAITFAGSG